MFKVPARVFQRFLEVGKIGGLIALRLQQPPRGIDPFDTANQSFPVGPRNRGVCGQRNQHLRTESTRCIAQLAQRLRAQNRTQRAGLQQQKLGGALEQRLMIEIRCHHHIVNGQICGLRVAQHLGAKAVGNTTGTLQLLHHFAHQRRREQVFRDLLHVAVGDVAMGDQRLPA